MTLSRVTEQVTHSLFDKLVSVFYRDLSTAIDEATVRALGALGPFRGLGKPPAGPPGMRLCLSPGAGLAFRPGGVMLNPGKWDSPGLRVSPAQSPPPLQAPPPPPPPLLLFLRLHSLSPPLSFPPSLPPSFLPSLSPSLCVSLLWPPSPQLSLQVFTLQSSSDSISSVSLSFPFLFSPPRGPGCPRRRLRRIPSPGGHLTAQAVLSPGRSEFPFL